MKTLLRNTSYLPGGDNWTAVRGVDVLLVDEQIEAIGAGLPGPPNALVIEGADLVWAPAFVNGHTHSPEMLGRGLVPMGSQPEWLVEAYSDGRDALSDADIARAIRLCAVETVRGGAVSVTDHYRQIPARVRAVRVAAETWATTGLRARIAMTLRDRSAPDGGFVDAPKANVGVPSTAETLRLAEELLDGPQAVPLGLGPSAPHRVTDELLVGVARLARQHGSFVHMHLCESREDTAACRALYGASAVAHLDKIGVLQPGLELVHAVHVDTEDLALMAARGVKMVHSPVANLRLGAGVAPVARALASGVEVVLATDGAGSNDSQSLLEAAKFALLAPRAARPASEWPTPGQIMRMATAGATLQARAQANLIAFDVKASAFVNVADDWATRIVLAARDSDLVHVVGNGRFLMRDRKVDLP
jgi:5-methylthioadenosine/S-adenosylhomocysteine deaminase